MRIAQILSLKLHHLLQGSAVIAMIILAASTCNAQTTPASPTEMPWSQDLNKYPGLQAEFNNLVEKLQHDIQPPAQRSESHLMPLLPESTISYAALSNYGDVAKQTLEVFRQELQESSVLRDWWQHGELAKSGPKVLDFLDRFVQLHQYLGEEIALSVSMKGREPSLLVFAEVRKPGLKKFLQETVAQLAGESKGGVRILDLQELATAEDKSPLQEFVVLVRPDFVVGAVDLATLRSFNARLEGHSREFASTPFGQRILKEYEGGVTLLVAADLHKILDQVPTEARQNATFQRTGFADVKYLIWDHKRVSGQAISQAELSFIAPRHGAASWLAKAGPLNSLDFVSPKAMLASTLVLTSPSKIFEDVKDLAGPSNSNAFAALAQYEQSLNLSVKDDLLGLLEGEFTVELDNVTPQLPVWKAILGVNDAKHLQQTLSTLMGVAHFDAGRIDEEGVTYYTVRIPNPKTTIEINYAFMDGYLVVGSSRDVVAEAIRLHQSGGSLRKSKKFLAALPLGHSLNASALFYEDPIAVSVLQLRRLAPEYAESLTKYSGESTPVVVCADGEETAIRSTTTSPALDAGGVLVVAAIAIPNLIRSRIAANESSAVASVRTVDSAEGMYASTYPQRGYAPNLATLGTDPHGPGNYSPDHAGLLDEILGNESCTDDAWCTKSGYHFMVTAICKEHLCEEYVVVATPVSDKTGGKSFCSTSDGVIRLNTGPPLTSPVSVSECQAWPPLE